MQSRVLQIDKHGQTCMIHRVRLASVVMQLGILCVF